PLIGPVSGLGSGANNVLNQSTNFAAGIANLTMLGMKYTGNAGTGTFTATSGLKTGTSNSITIAPSTVATTTTLTSSLNPSTYGASVTFTATVTGSTNPTCGTIDFKDGTLVINTATLSGSNSAAYATAGLTTATHSITAVYTPAASSCNFSGSTSNTVSQT